MFVNSIKELVEIAIDYNHNTYLEFSFANLSRKQAKIMEGFTGVDLTGTEIVIDTYGIRHALQYHGNEEQEAKRGQVAVLQKDFSLVPQIIQRADAIDYAGKNKMGQHIFNYRCRNDALYIAAMVVRLAKKGNKLVFVTMYKQK